jgi:hypothetical protein
MRDGDAKGRGEKRDTCFGGGFQTRRVGRRWTPHDMRIIEGALLGAGLGAVAVWCSSGAKTSDDDDGAETALGRAASRVDGSPYLAASGYTRSLLLDVGPLFQRLDGDAFETLLAALEAHLRLFQEARSRNGDPRVVFEALQARRRGEAALGELVRVSRRRAPSQAADLQEVFDGLHKALQDMVHNIQQESSLHFMNRSDAPCSRSR